MPEFNTGVDIPMEDLFDTYATASSIAEATAFRSVNTGDYTLQVTKVEPKHFDADPAKGTDARDLAKCTAKALDSEGKSKGNVFFKASWQERRTAKGYLDNQSKLWGQICGALYPDKTNEERAAVPSAQVMNDMLAVPMNSYIVLSFIIGDNPATFFQPETEEQLIECRTKGYKPINFVRSISQVRV